MTVNTVTVKRFIKRGLQSIAAKHGRHTRKPSQPELLLLMYHRVLPVDDPRARLEEPGMMVSPETFQLHMSIVKRQFKPIHLSTWLELKKNGKKLPLRACAITFDDGWADNYEFAFPVLRQLDIPATIFLVSEMVGKNQKFWPERLSALLSNIATNQPGSWSHPALDWIKNSTTSYDFTSCAPTQEQLSEIIAAAKAYSDEDINQRLDAIEEKLQLDISSKASLLNWQQVNEMCASGLIEAGSHTCHHTRLTADKNEAVLRKEIIDSKRTIENKTSLPVKTFCYPNGDYSELARTIVEQNYDGAVTTEHGWNTVTDNDFLLRRIGLHEDISKDATSFLARLSGWL